MAATKSTNTRLGAGCLMLFALPFAAVGVGALGWAGWTVLQWQSIASWQPVSAEIVNVDLEEHDGDDSTTYQAVAAYRYQVAGQTYTSTRVAIDSGADNIGDFQHRVYRELRAAHERGTPATAYVDPADPTSAVLNRELRFGMLAFKGLFGIVFGAVGFGLLIGARYAGKKLAAENVLRGRYPSEPWRWKPEWANNRIAAETRAAAYGVIGFAVLWNLISLPLALFIPGEIASGNWVAAIGLLFPLIGIGLAAWALRAWLQLKRFKTPTLTLSRTPVPLGGRLKGTIRVEAPVPVAGEVRLELQCVEEVTRGTGKNRSREERLLWQKQWRVPRAQCQLSPFATIPVDVAVPGDQPATTMEEGSDQVRWRLEAAAECPGPDFYSRFELPVFATGEQRSPADMPVASTERTERPDGRALAALGIDYERLPQGGEVWTFRRAQHKGVAAALTVFAAVWGVAGVALFFTDAPLVIPIVFTLFDSLLVWWVLSMWFTEYRVTLDRGLLTLARRGFMARAPIEIPQQWIKRVRAKRGMQAGNKLYYDLEVETADGKHTAASSLADYDVASWLAQHWATSGARA